MRVFVVCVGRCGSVSFREACRYAQNYTTGHESKCGLLEYPDQHIEVSAQVRSVIVHIARKYPDAKWVHLRREPASCIPSIARLDRGAFVEHYRLLFNTIMPSNQPIDVAYRYYWAENDKIEAQLQFAVPEGQRLTMHLETIRDGWRTFWAWIGAQGNYEASLMAWDVKRNTAEERGEL